MNCQKCNFQNEESAKFCRNCGEKLDCQQLQQSSVNCPICNFTNIGDMQYCGKCGAKLNGTQKRNVLGVVGFVFSIVTLLLLCVIFLCICDIYGMGDVIDFFAILSILFGLLGFGFSLPGIFYKNKRKNLSISSLIILSVYLVIFILITAFI